MLFTNLFIVTRSGRDTTVFVAEAVCVTPLATNVAVGVTVEPFGDDMFGTRNVKFIVPELPAGITSDMLHWMTPPDIAGADENPPVEAVPLTYTVDTDVYGVSVGTGTLIVPASQLSTVELHAQEI